MTTGPDDGGGVLPAEQRPLDHTPIHTAALPSTPTRDRSIPATAWVEAPATLLASGDDLEGAPVPRFTRRIGRWLLWRAGPAKADARYTAIDAEDLARSFTFRLHPDGSADGTGPSGAHHTRFRGWKEDLRDAGGPAG